MSVVKSLWSIVQDDPIFMRRINGWLTVIWFIAAFPICVFLSHSLSFLVFVSVYAVVTGHWATWVAAKVETKQDQREVERQQREDQ